MLSKVWEEVSLPESFDPKLSSFLIQIRARMYMYSIHPSTGRWWKLFLGSTTKVDLNSIENRWIKTDKDEGLRRVFNEKLTRKEFDLSHTLKFSNP